MGPVWPGGLPPALPSRGSWRLSVEALCSLQVFMGTRWCRGVRVTPDCGVWGAQVTFTPPPCVFVIGDGVSAFCNARVAGERLGDLAPRPTPRAPTGRMRLGQVRSGPGAGGPHPALVRLHGALPGFAVDGQGQLVLVACPHTGWRWGPVQLILPALGTGDGELSGTSKTCPRCRMAPVVPGAAPAPEPWDPRPRADPGGRGGEGRSEAPGALGAAACSRCRQPGTAAAGRVCACACVRVQGEQAWPRPSENVRRAAVCGTDAGMRSAALLTARSPCPRARQAEAGLQPTRRPGARSHRAVGSFLHPAVANEPGRCWP